MPGGKRSASPTRGAGPLPPPPPPRCCGQSRSLDGERTRVRGAAREREATQKTEGLARAPCYVARALRLLLLLRRRPPPLLLRRRPRGCGRRRRFARERRRDAGSERVAQPRERRESHRTAVCELRHTIKCGVLHVSTRTRVSSRSERRESRSSVRRHAHLSSQCATSPGGGGATSTCSVSPTSSAERRTESCGGDGRAYRSAHSASFPACCHPSIGTSAGGSCGGGEAGADGGGGAADAHSPTAVSSSPSASAAACSANTRASPGPRNDGRAARRTAVSAAGVAIDRRNRRARALEPTVRGATPTTRVPRCGVTTVTTNFLGAEQHHILSLFAPTTRRHQHTHLVRHADLREDADGQDDHPRGRVLGHHRQREGQDPGQGGCVPRRGWWLGRVEAWTGVGDG